MCFEHPLTLNVLNYIFHNFFQFYRSLHAYGKNCMFFKTVSQLYMLKRKEKSRNYAGDGFPREKYRYVHAYSCTHLLKVDNVLSFFNGNSDISFVLTFFFSEYRSGSSPTKTLPCFIQPVAFIVWVLYSAVVPFLET